MATFWPTLGGGGGEWASGYTGLTTAHNIFFVSHPVQGKYSQIRQANIIDEFFYQKRSGFFVEAGAGNGFDKSNTIFLEYERNWRGLLVEPDPILFKDLLESGRRDPKDLLFHACLSTQKYPQKLMIDISGGIDDYDTRAVVVAQLAERTLPIPEVRGSNTVIVNFYIEHLFSVNCIEKSKINNGH